MARALATLEALDLRLQFNHGPIFTDVTAIPGPPVYLPDPPLTQAAPAGKAAIKSGGRLDITIQGGSKLDVSQRGSAEGSTSNSKTRVAFFTDGSADAQILYFTKVKTITVTGTDRADQIDLEPGLPATTVNAGGGDDVVTAHGSGTRTIYGGAGNDRLYGGDGNDALYGEAGDDRLYGAGGDDLLDGGAGKDYLAGGAGRNHLIGGTGSDRIDLVTSDDTLQHDSKDKIIAVG